MSATELTLGQTERIRSETTCNYMPQNGRYPYDLCRADAVWSEVGTYPNRRCEKHLSTDARTADAQRRKRGWTSLDRTYVRFDAPARRAVMTAEAQQANENDYDSWSAAVRSAARREDWPELFGLMEKRQVPRRVAAQVAEAEKAEAEALERMRQTSTYGR